MSAPTLAGKTAVITGGTRGLGLALARACAAAGATVVVAGASAASTARAVAQLREAGAAAHGCPCDVRRPAQVDALADFARTTCGGFDIWVNNAGVAGPYGPTASIPPAEFLAPVETNILGVYYGSLAALRHFLPRRAGKLINVLGRGGDGRIVPFQNTYACSKIWIRNFTLTLAKEYTESGVGIFALNPGMMRTDFMLRPQVVAGHEEKLRALPTVLRLLAFPPEVAARRGVWLAGPATDGRSGLIAKTTTFPMLLGQALREGWRMLRRLPAEGLELTIETTPAAQEQA